MIRLGIECFEGALNPPLSIPGVQGFSSFKGHGEPFIGTGYATGKCLRGGIKFSQGLNCGRDGFGHGITDGSAIGDGHVLFGHRMSPVQCHGPRIGYQSPGKHMQQRGLAAAVLTDDADTRRRSDGQVNLLQYRGIAKSDVNTAEG